MARDRPTLILHLTQAIMNSLCAPMTQGTSVVGICLMAKRKQRANKTELQADATNPIMSPRPDHLAACATVIALVALVPVVFSYVTVEVVALKVVVARVLAYRMSKVAL